MWAIAAANILHKPVVVFLGLTLFLSKHQLAQLHCFRSGAPRTSATGFFTEMLDLCCAGGLTMSWPGFASRLSHVWWWARESDARTRAMGGKVAADRLLVPFWTVDAGCRCALHPLKKEHMPTDHPPRINALLDEFLISPGNPRSEYPGQPAAKLESRSINEDLLTGSPMDTSVRPVLAFQGGTRAALDSLTRFVRERLKGYTTQA